MPNIYDEIKIVFRGPCERFFIAYKPLGWHVCSPSGAPKLDHSLSSVICAKLRISEDSIKFPSKLKINQTGLVIGTTDDSMYSQISKMIETGDCSKTYTCLLSHSLDDFLSKLKDLNPEFKSDSHENSGLEGKVTFGLRKAQKSLPSDPDVALDPDPGSNPFSFLFKVQTLDSFLSNPENGLDSYPFERNRYSILEVGISQRSVDKNFHQILGQLGINLVESFESRLNESYKMAQLSRIQLPHPILPNRLVTGRLNSPLEGWVRSLARSS